MRILITGGYGFIGSHLVDKLSKEGHRVYIIDNLSTGKIENVNVNAKFYNFNIEDTKCNEIFKSESFDVVFHLAENSSVNDNNLQKDINVGIDLSTELGQRGIINLLSLSQKYAVKKFIYISSVAAYGECDAPCKEEDSLEPMSKYSVGIYLNEYLCRKWDELYGLNTLILRVSNVYGPKQGLQSQDAVIPRFIKSILTEQTLTFYGDGNQMRDFIYINDVIEALYRCLQPTYSPVLNISYGTSHNINELVELIKSITKTNKVVNTKYVTKRNGDIQNSVVDNSRVKNELDWIPLYTLEDGLINTIEWFSPLINSELKEKKTRIKTKNTKFKND